MKKNQKAVLGALSVGLATYAITSSRKNRMMMHNMYDMHDLQRATKKMRKIAKDIL